jgi:hypothetical protein
MTLTPLAPASLKALAGRKAALVKHHGPDDPRTLAACAELRTALLVQAIREAARTLPPMSAAEKEELAALLMDA